MKNADGLGMKTILLTIFILFIGCAPRGKAKATHGDSIFRQWKSYDSLVALDLKDAAFGVNKTVTYSNLTTLGAVSCSCSVTVNGDQSAGTFTANDNCAKNGDPLVACFTSGLGGSYAVSENGLTLCTSANNPSTCFTVH